MVQERTIIKLGGLLRLRLILLFFAYQLLGVESDVTLLI